MKLLSSSTGFVAFFILIQSGEFIYDPPQFRFYFMTFPVQQISAINDKMTSFIDFSGPI